MFDTIHTNPKFSPSNQLRFRKRNFVLEDKVIKTVTDLQYKNGDDDYTWWGNIPTIEETVRLNKEEDLYTDYGVIK